MFFDAELRRVAIKIAVIASIACETRRKIDEALAEHMARSILSTPFANHGSPSTAEATCDRASQQNAAIQTASIRHHKKNTIVLPKFCFKLETKIIFSPNSVLLGFLMPH